MFVQECGSEGTVNLQEQVFCTRMQAFSASPERNEAPPEHAGKIRHLDGLQLVCCTPSRCDATPFQNLPFRNHPWSEFTSPVEPLQIGAIWPRRYHRRRFAYAVENSVGTLRFHAFPFTTGAGMHLLISDQASVTIIACNAASTSVRAFAPTCSGCANEPVRKNCARLNGALAHFIRDACHRRTFWGEKPAVLRIGANKRSSWCVPADGPEKPHATSIVAWQAQG
jgi:hypothetical protein